MLEIFGINNAAAIKVVNSFHYSIHRLNACTLRFIALDKDCTRNLAMLSFILTDRERSRSSIKVGEVSEGRTGVRVPAMYAVFSCSSQP